MQEMLQQRGYTVTNSSHQGTTLLLGDSGDESIVVFCDSEQKIGVGGIKERIGILQSLAMHACIIVYGNSVTSMAAQMVKKIPDVSVELFSEAELQYNVTKHRLVPKHERLTPRERENFLAAYGSKIPVLLTSDPVARFYKFNAGDIVRVIRSRASSDSYITYRIVQREK